MMKRLEHVRTICTQLSIQSATLSAYLLPLVIPNDAMHVPEILKQISFLHSLYQCVYSL